MQNEVRIYQRLSNLQGIYIPNLKCYGYFENGMCYVISTTLVGKPLSFYKYITEGQKVKGMLALNAIHDRGVLHNDIRADNILLDNHNNDVYLIDFGMSSTDYDIMEDWSLFNEEKFKLDFLFSHYRLKEIKLNRRYEKDYLNSHVACLGCKADEDREQFDTTNKRAIKILKIDLKLED
ncbi:hypothetical protein RhiirC2_787665 [Rhizophagus irregularis]|uniref:Protein kinase domain-containing protein n=1 Tax=Rhizophagus irregularis TaxID=588596 RepID=A0A2N1MRU3_9GLOM|nr:hypothetical protein RhiirC2_787665 [Rhizophagus irregularis]